MNNSLLPAIPGLDALALESNSALRDLLRSKSCALLSNPTGVARDGRSALAICRELSIEIRVLFSPEHGPNADREGDIESFQGIDNRPNYSLYGATRRPTPEMLDGIEMIICDLQDVGARFYTYSSTIFHILEEALPRGIAVVILDRPNPLGGLSVEGPIIEDELRSFIGYAPLPVTHGLTMGELANFFVRWRGLDESLLHIARVENWKRAQRLDSTGLTWHQPSPNLPTFNAAAWYPGLSLLEFSGVSVGRGTEAPFQILAAPWLKAQKLITHLPKQLECDGITAHPIKVTPNRATFEGESCVGVQFNKNDASSAPVYPVGFGVCVMSALRMAHPDFSSMLWEKSGQLLGSKLILDWLWDGEIERALDKIRNEGQTFRMQTESIRLYE